MKLYFFPIAPNPTKVRLYLAEKAHGGAQIPLELHTVSIPEGEHQSEAHRARNPFGTLPVLEFDDGRCLLESLAIIEYLEERFPSPPMIGENAEERAIRRQIERIADLRVLGTIAGLVHATRSPLGGPPCEVTAARNREALPKGLGWLEALASDGRPFLAGQTPGVADCTVAAALQFGRFRELPEVALADDYPNLHRWHEAYRERPPAKEVLSL